MFALYIKSSPEIALIKYCSQRFKVNHKKNSFFLILYRWPNIIKKSKEEWIIIDFEDSYCPDIENSGRKLSKDGHAPELSNISAKSQDLWSVGNLIKTSSILKVHSELKTLKHQLLSDEAQLRPSIDQAIIVVENLLKDCMEDQSN